MCHATLDIRAPLHYVRAMEIESIRHKGLRRFFETGNAKGLVGDTGRLRKMLAFIDDFWLLGVIFMAILVAPSLLRMFASS